MCEQNLQKNRTYMYMCEKHDYAIKYFILKINSLNMVKKSEENNIFKK